MEALANLWGNEIHYQGEKITHMTAVTCATEEF
jgi:hypothetical protein